MNLKKDSKPFHQYISNHTKYKSKVGPLKVTQDNEETKILDDDTEIANALNDTLGSVFVSDENINELPHTVKLPCNSPLSNIIFYEHKVSEAITKLRPGTAPGPDGIRAKIIIELNQQISPILTRILNLSMQTGKIPSQWKLSNVAPIFKSGNTHDPSNYRGVSMEDLLLKIGEKLLKNH